MTSRMVSLESTGYLPDKAKITHSTINNLAEEYAGSGVAERVDSILQVLPSRLKTPIRYTFANHVTKERPLSVLHAADELGVPREKSIGAAAVIDVLWNVGIVVDDVYDKDETNARMEPSAWNRFGKSDALAASTAAVAASVIYAGKEYGARQSLTLSRQLQQGIASLTQSRGLSLESPVDEYYRNYDMRSAFYTNFPLAALRRHTEAKPPQIAGAQLALAQMNRAGQMINDLQDFDESADRSRTESFSDIRNGVSSIPIRHIWQSLDSRNQTRFGEIHGKNDLSNDDVVYIRNLVRYTDMRASVLSRINTTYSEARDVYIGALSPSENTISWLDQWLTYKQTQALHAAQEITESPDERTEELAYS